MVSTSRNKNCKFLFCLGEIIILFRAFCQLKPLLKLCGSQFFFKKNIIAPSRILSSQVGMYFFTNFSFQLVEADFLADRGSILLFRASLGFMGMGGSGSRGRVFWLVWLAGAHLLGGGRGWSRWWKGILCAVKLFSFIRCFFPASGGRWWSYNHSQDIGD